MKLIIIEISGEDYSALNFEQGAMKIKDVWEELQDGTDVFNNEDEGWDASVRSVILIESRKEANKILNAMRLATSIVGDYDGMKSTNWYSMVTE